MQSTSSQNIRRMVGIAILSALVVVLQIVATFIRIGPVPVTLTLVPIVIGGAIYGIRAGAILGFAFCAVVVIMGINGVAPLGHSLFLISPAAMILSFLARGAIAGTAAACAYKLLAEKNKYFAAILAAVVCPVVNTGLFLATMRFLFYDRLVELTTAAGAEIAYFLFIGLAGTNFLIELGINIVLAPVIIRIISIARRRAA